MHVSLISGESINELTQGTEYTITDRVVTLSAPTTLKIKIYRQTTTTPLVGWADASVLRAADMNVQSTQLLHLAEETSDLAQDGGLSKDTTDDIWDARFNRIKNLLDPTDPGDAMTLRYANDKQYGLIAALKSEGAAQNTSIVSTGDSQNTRIITTGNTQNTRLTTTGDTQNSRLTNTGNNYVATMTSLKDTATTQASNASQSASSASTSASTATTQASNASSSASSASTSASTATTKATEATNSANLSKAWAMSDSSPDGVSGHNSSKTWATNSANSASEASTYASNASTSAANAKTSETNAANSAKAAKQSEENAKTWDPTQYVKSVTEENGKLTVTKGGGDSTIINLIDTFYPIGTIYISADKNKTKADFPFMRYGTWEEIPANLVLQTGAASEAGTQRSAGLPNITGRRVASWGGGDNSVRGYTTGCFKQDPDKNYCTAVNGENWNDGTGTGFSFDASLSNPIYGASNTVQPPAYMVRAWVRMA